MRNYIKLTIILFSAFFINLTSTLAQDMLAIPVSGACGMCKTRIEGAAQKIKGVNKATYDLEKQLLLVQTGSGFSRKVLVDAILAVGHDVDGLTADDDIYEALDGCCYYREVEVHGLDEVGDIDDVIGHTDGNMLTGTVYEREDDGHLEPLIGAAIQWLGTNIGVISDLDGKFEIEMNDYEGRLIVSYIGYDPDTVMVERAGDVSIIISTPSVLDEVTITHKRRTTEISYLEPIKIHKISSTELLKAACCNLAESFDTTPAIDASSTDAVTGTRKIEMLGLAGPYVQITTENMPGVRGLAALQGLSLIPGPWIESMQLNMGAGSVVNGFESITGQINVEMQKPNADGDLFLNAYGNQAGRLEMNSYTRHNVSDNWSMANMLHASTQNVKRDDNNDGFLDLPTGNQFGFINRWKWSNGEGQEGQVGIRLVHDDKVSGQEGFRLGSSDRSQAWGADMNTNRVELWAKRGMVNINTPYKSLGMQFSGVYHDQKAQFGLRRYDATQKSLYFNLIYQTIVDNTNHQVRMGTSVQYDNFDELVVDTRYERNEIVPGVFGEYTFMGTEKFTLLAGMRADYHNNFGLFFTPRLNLRYAPDETTVFRVAAGRGQRTASIFAENIGLFASNRTFFIEGNGNTPYGLDAEVAWSLGVSATKELKIGNKMLVLSADFNRIDFQNQIVVDLDRNTQSVYFYNLNGDSYSNSLQIQGEMSPTDWLDIRLAYRYNDVQTTYGEELLRKPLTSPHRAFANLSVKMGRGWSVDYTVNRLSSVRIPSTITNPEEFRLPQESPAYFMSNAQVTKSWNKKFDIYFGGENIFNYKLDDPIISAQNPFSPYFDSSLVWGPVMGVNIYAGLRYNL